MKEIQENVVGKLDSLSVKRRKLLDNAPKCCSPHGISQVQLVEWIYNVKWKCRKCKKILC